MCHHFSFPTQIVFGEGAVGEVGALARKLGGARALIVTDKGVASAGLVAPVQRSLDSAGVGNAIFDGVSPNPTEANVDDGIAVYRAEACDLVIGVGGGSAMDAAK